MEPFPMQSLGLAAAFPPQFNPEAYPPTVLSLDFHREGQWLVSCDSSGAVLQVDSLSGCVVKRFTATGGAEAKHPVGLVRYTHHSLAVLCAPTRFAQRTSIGGLGSAPGEQAAHDVRYLSLYDHSYQRAFQGHTAPISSMAMCPADDSFATGSDDGSVRLWHLKASKSVACLRLPSGCSSPRVAYDPTGKVFACAYQNGPASSSSSGSGSEHIIKLYDGRNYGTGPFATFEHSPAAVSKFLQAQGFAAARAHADALASTPWAGLAFSPNETHLLVTSESGLLLLLDAFDGNLLHAFDSTTVETEAPASAQTATTAAAAGAGAPPAPVSDAGSTSVGGAGEAAAAAPSGAAAASAAAAPGACFTPDGKFVVFGTKGGEVCAWAVPPAPPSPDENSDAHSRAAAAAAAAKDAAAAVANTPAVRLRGHASGVSCVACSPAYGVLASACSVIALWTPKDGDSNEALTSPSDVLSESNAMAD